MITTESTHKASKIAEALELLNETAKEKKDDLNVLFSDKYAHIHQFIDKGKDMIEKTKKAAEYALLKDEYKIKEVIGEADKRVHKDPWVYIAGASAVALLVGYLMGSKNK